MGYTHYWDFKPAPRGQAKAVEQKYIKALLDCQRIVLAYSKVNGGLSGFSAHTKLGEYGGLKLNGSGPDAHEDFVLREHYKQNEGGGFCKTAGKPYDTVVVACLIVLKHRLGAQFEAHSDGEHADWAAGLQLAKSILGLKTLKIPETIRPNRLRILG